MRSYYDIPKGSIHIDHRLYVVYLQEVASHQSTKTCLRCKTYSKNFQAHESSCQEYQLLRYAAMVNSDCVKTGYLDLESS
jgi:hypothetical protein